MHTDRVLTEQAPLNGDERLTGFKRLFGARPHVALLTDAQGRVLAVNRFAAAQPGMVRPGMPAAALYAPWAGKLVRLEGFPAARACGYWRGEMELAGMEEEAEPVSLLIEYQPAAGESQETYLLLHYDLGDFDSYDSRLLFKRLFEAHPHPMWAYDLVTLRFLVVNAAAVTSYGYTESEFLDMTIRDIRPERELARLDADLAATPAKGAQRAGYWQHRKKDGTLITVDVSSHSITLAGRAARLVFAHDVTEKLRMEEALHASQEMQQLVINHIPHQIFWKDLDSVYRGCNETFARAAGVGGPAFIAGKRDADLPWAANAERIVVDDRTIIDTGEANLNQEDHMLFADGSMHWFLINKLPLHDAQGRIIGVLGTIEDISQRKQVEQTLALRGRALEASVSAIVITAEGPEGSVIEYANQAFGQLTGHAPAAVAGHTLEPLLQSGDANGREVLRAALKARADVTRLLQCRHHDGSLYWCQLHVAPVRSDGGVSHHVCVLSDMTELINYQAQLEHQANHDALTQLPNRHLFSDRLEQALSYARRYGHAVWVVFIDLDNFKLVNDSLGHQAGDQLLRTVAGRLRACVRASDTVARLGGDEFMLLLLGGSEVALPQGLLQNVLESVAAPVPLGETEVAITCSIGVSAFPADGDDGQLLLKHADIAMYRAKETGRNQAQFYEPAMQARVAERAAIEMELRYALPRQELRLYYQPKVSLETGALSGMEALLRWPHPRLGMVSPDRFIGVAEDTGQIVEIGRWVIRTACAQARAWQLAGQAPLRVAVNVSARQFRDPGLADDIVAALHDTGLAPQYLELELTESMMMHSISEVLATVTRLKGLGIALSIDDFGTGYSNLSSLKLLPLSQLKIDQSFVRDMLDQPNVSAIVRSVIALGHSLGFSIIAEGVETEAQLAYLRSCGCDEIQGYYFSRPLDTDAFTALLQSGRRLVLPGAPDPAQRTLLLLDDEPHVLTALKRMLRVDGYTILTAQSARDAFDLLALHPVQVIISDQRMPEMNGTEFLRRVKQLYPDTVRIILSGYAELETLISAINTGEIYRFFTKPWDEEGLRASLREAFRYQALMRGGAKDGATAVSQFSPPPPGAAPPVR
ncbi:diguanylate cyclase [Massilia sp. Root351]|uniref:EAL domain-containing protein n=1 Tax=Massilia sp. Root351 TaxID=1736522 RepID=UPI0007111E68|nr:EAL domain-containing protein [Massilia sp. Root351]KQV87194.1 diguanylate cyclase [Massilia sp. Root351]